MRIRNVTAHAFGALVGETLEFADGMTVVVGDNESAKSTWHAAIFAALCGRRRGAGRPREDDQRFADLHKPWDRTDWLVSAEIVLDDGRRVEMRQDLAGKVDCHARDLDLGKDVSDQVMNEGTPDAARWLGLDRSSFVATACVEQAQMLRVRGDAGGLQEHLQRAAATASTDTTAAAALDRITAFERDRVGLDRANSTKPLRRALANVGIAEERRDAAQRQHDEYLRLAGQADALRDEAGRADAALRAAEAAGAASEAAQLADRAGRAADLQASLGSTRPASISEDDALARRVAEALYAWHARPAEPALSGPTAQQIQERLRAFRQEKDDIPRPALRVRLILLAACVAAAAGIAVLASGSRDAGIALLAAAAVLIAVGLVFRSRRPVAGTERHAERRLLETQLEARQQSERRAEQDRAKRADAARLVIESADACRLTAETRDGTALALEKWSRERTEQMQRLAAEQSRWAELQALLNGRSLAQLQQQAARSAQHAQDLAPGLTPAMIAAAGEAVASEQLAALRQAARDADTEAARASGDLQRFARSVISVAETEETLDAARAELTRVRDLQETLTLTRQFLENAQNRIHRDIAPALAAMVKLWLPVVTSDRYIDVTVDPTTLQVDLCGPSRRWRKADLLSYGTAEQVYLLLRIALADHLTNNNDRCPLILDDVTVHADAARTRDILGLLLKIATERQIILFTQEEQVAAWAREHLTPPHHAIRILAPPAES